MTTVARGFSIIFCQKSPDIAHSLKSHQVIFEDNRINGNEDIVLLCF